MTKGVGNSDFAKPDAYETMNYYFVLPRTEGGYHHGRPFQEMFNGV
ncbi:MAG: hypothetical protein MUC41_15120 [Syntrophobacteraceae bacterium]|jgi:hypothetical protein|nr:hypothetical protein [Syntrophobacteraceae bacterium]